MRWWHGGVAAGLGVAMAILLMLIMTSQSSPIATATPPAEPAQVRSTVTRSAPLATRTPSRTPRAHPIMPRTPHEEGLLAAIAQSGEGMVRCQLPDSTPVNLDHLNWAGQVGDVLTLATTEASGSVPLMRDEPRPTISDDATPTEIMEHHAAIRAWSVRARQPFALASWSGGWPGAMGNCEVHDVNDRVSVTVQLRDEHGDAVSSGMVWSANESTNVDHEGRGTLLLWPDLPLTVRAMDGSSQHRLEGEATTVVQAGATLTIVMSPPQSSQASLLSDEGIEAAVTTHEDFMEEHNRYLRAALSRPGLSTGAKAQLQAWIDREERNSNEFYDIVDTIEQRSVVTVQR